MLSFQVIMFSAAVLLASRSEEWFPQALSQQLICDYRLDGHLAWVLTQMRVLFMRAQVPLEHHWVWQVRINGF
jgi:hypothetical protein